MLRGFVQLIATGPADASIVLVLGPGDDGQPEDAHATVLAEAIGRAGIRVVRFGFRCRLDGRAERDAALRAVFEQALATVDAEHLVLGGISRGARVALQLAPEHQVCALVLLAYPFHERGDPDATEAVLQLAETPVPVGLWQGTRDSHGNREQIKGYPLPASVQLHWLEDANHQLVPRASSGYDQPGLLVRAAEEVHAFIQSVVPAAPGSGPSVLRAR